MTIASKIKFSVLCWQQQFLWWLKFDRWFLAANWLRKLELIRAWRHSNSESRLGILTTGINSGNVNVWERVAGASGFHLDMIADSQRIGSRPLAATMALVFENGLLPKNPRCADSGDGCGATMTWWRLEISFCFLAAGLPQSRKTRSSQAKRRTQEIR